MKKIVIVKGKSLLTQGIFSYLSTRLSQARVYALDVSNMEEFETIKNLQPDIVIFETEYLWKEPCFLLLELLQWFPHLTILELHANSSEVNIIKSEHRRPANLDEIVSFLNINEPALSKPAML